VNVVTFQYQGNVLPYFVYGWEEEYLSLGQVDRVVLLVAHIRRCHYEAYGKLSSDGEKKILFVRHQTLITKTEECLQSIKNFIGEGPSNIRRLFSCSKIVREIIAQQHPSLLMIKLLRKTTNN